MRKHFATPSEIHEKTVEVNIDAAIKQLDKAIQHGDEKQLRAARKSASELCPTGGPVIYCNKPDAAQAVSRNTVQVVDDDSHSITIASTGKGKTRRFVYPSIFSDILSGTNVVVNDMKGEIYQTAKPLLSAMGYNTYVLDLRNPEETPNHYNPLGAAWDQWRSGNRDRAFMTIRSLALCIFEPFKSSDDPFWSSSAQDYFTGLALSMLENEVSKGAFTIESIGLIDREGERNAIPSMMKNKALAGDVESRRIDVYGAALARDSLARRFLSGPLAAKGNTITSILSVFRQPMSLYVGHNGLMSALGFNDFTPENLTNPKTAVFLISPDETRAFGSIVVSILNQIMSGLITIAQSEFNGKLPHRVDFFLDEMGNLPAEIPDMDALVSAARSRNMRFHFVLQSIDQLAHVYGEELSQVIQDNCDTWVYMGTKSLRFLQQLSDMCGEIQLVSGDTRKLLPVDVLQHLETRRQETETMVLLGSLRPYVAALRDIGTYEQLHDSDEFEAKLSKSETKQSKSRKRETFDFIGFVAKTVAQYEKQTAANDEIVVEAEKPTYASTLEARSRPSRKAEKSSPKKTKRRQGLFPSKQRGLSTCIVHSCADSTMAKEACAKMRELQIEAQEEIYRNASNAISGIQASATILLLTNADQQSEYTEAVNDLTEDAGTSNETKLYTLFAENQDEPDGLPTNMTCLKAGRSIDSRYILNRIIGLAAEDKELSILLANSLIKTLETESAEDKCRKDAIGVAVNGLRKLRTRLKYEHTDRLWRICLNYQQFGLTYQQMQFLQKCLAAVDE